MKYIELLNEFLTESNDGILNESSEMTQGDKVSAVAVILEKIFNPIRSIVAGIDLSFIHKTRGDFFRLPESDNIDNIIMYLTKAIKNSNSPMKKIVEKDISIVAHAIMCIQDLKYNFELAYKNRQTLLISLYAFVVVSIIYATSHIVSSAAEIDPSSGSVLIKDTIDYESSNYITALKFFNENTNSGNFKKQLKDVLTLKEYINESGVVGVINSVDVGKLIVNGFNKLASVLKDKQNIGFKVIGVVIILLAIREIVFTLNNSRVSIKSILQNLNIFDGFLSGKRMDNSDYETYRRTSNVLNVDIDDSSKMASRELGMDDRRIKKDIDDVISDKYRVDFNEPSGDSLFI